MLPYTLEPCELCKEQYIFLTFTDINNTLSILLKKKCKKTTRKNKYREKKI